VIDRGHEEIALLDPGAVLLGDLIVRVNEPHSGNSAEANDDPWLYELHLSAEVVDTGILLSGQRIAVFWGTAFEDVCDINVLAVDIHGVKKFIEELSRSAYEGSAAQILLLAGSFAHEHKVGIFVANAENTVGPGLVKRAFLTGCTFII
jgi:hypothetical protein